MSNFQVGNLVRPNITSNEKNSANWNPEGELRIKWIRQGKLSGSKIICAVDERGYKYTGVEDCFVKISEKATQ